MSTFDTSIQHQDAPVWSSAIKWGLISGGIGVVLTMLFYNMGMMDPENASNSWISTVAILAIGFLIVYLGLKNYRDSQNQGHLTLGRGVMWSICYGLIAGIIGAIFSFIFFNFLAPDYITGIMEFQMAEMEEQGMGEDELEAATAMMGIFMNPFAFAIIGIISQLFYALVEGLIASLILKTR